MVSIGTNVKSCAEFPSVGMRGTIFSQGVSPSAIVSGDKPTSLPGGKQGMTPPTKTTKGGADRPYAMIEPVDRSPSLRTTQSWFSARASGCAGSRMRFGLINTERTWR